MKTGGGLDFKQQATKKQSYSAFIEHTLWSEADEGYVKPRSSPIAYLSLAKM